MRLWRPLLRCRLCWRITITVFGLILAVESLLVVPSARSFEQREWRHLAAQAQVAVDSALSEDRAPPRRLARLLGHYGLRSVAVYGADGSLLAGAGPLTTRPVASAADIQARPAFTEDEDRILVATWRSAQIPGATVAAAIDASRVLAETRSYMLRIAGLVAIIVVVVTIGTMLALDLWILRPLLRLRESSLRAGAKPDLADSFKLRTRRRDEMGDLIAAHNSMLAHVADSWRRDRALAEERARHLARHDPATGMPNRTALLEFVARQRETGTPVTLLHLNVLRFRILNSTYGAQAGDRILCTLARRLQRAAAPEDFVTRLGADRFAVARSGDVAPREAESLAERLLRETSTPMEVGEGKTVTVGARVGIARLSGGDLAGEELLSQAELALARTYEDAACKYQFYSPHLAAQARERQMLAQDLERALQREELFVVLQPKFALGARGSAGLCGAEALLRWRHRERGLVSPAAFIPIAESSGLIDPLGEFVLRTVGERALRWRMRHGWSPRIAVNLSGQQFGRPELTSWLERVLGGNRALPGLLELEITETAAMRDVERSATAIAELRKAGFRVSIDDFGTGYSSLSYLRRFAVDAIKIDKSFIDDIGRDRHAEAICSAILRLGQTLGTRVVAEGVETASQVEFLRRRKCDEVQGFLFGKPVGIEEFEREWLSKNAARYARPSS